MSDSVLLAPHNDDETLFAAFTLLRHRPRVIVVLRSYRQAHLGGPTYEEREAETREAMNILGCSWEQWHYADDDAPWAAVGLAIHALAARTDRVCYAPLPRHDLNGHDPTLMPSWRAPGVHHHDAIGALAQEAFRDRVRFYTTYTREGRDRSGTPINPGPVGRRLKRAALDCYPSQAAYPATAAHFVAARDDPTEYEVTP